MLYGLVCNIPGEHFMQVNWGQFVTLHAKLCSAVYCYRSCLCACLQWAACVCVCVCLWVCYHNNSKLLASILTKLGLSVKVVTISS